MLDFCIDGFAVLVECLAVKQRIAGELMLEECWNADMLEC